MSLIRVAANLAGAFGGAALLVVIGQPLVAMAIGIILLGLVCHLLKQNDAMRPAFGAVVIVTLTDESTGWRSPLNRVAAVIIGCACALVIGYLFDKFSKFFKPAIKDERKKPRHQK
jgi:uncharacterized membrane protein YgaE (UPF0421/DUF939 family)